MNAVQENLPSIDTKALYDFVYRNEVSSHGYTCIGDPHHHWLMKMMALAEEFPDEPSSIALYCGPVEDLISRVRADIISDICALLGATLYKKSGWKLEATIWRDKLQIQSFKAAITRAVIKIMDATDIAATLNGANKSRANALRRILGNLYLTGDVRDVYEADKARHQARAVLDDVLADLELTQ